MTARPFTGRELVIATHNEGKAAEFRGMFEGRGLVLFSAAGLGLSAPRETGTTFFENAAIKAGAAALASGRPALADDSGLCVDALGGAPGVRTSDWVGSPPDWKAAMQRVHDLTRDKPDKSAHFVSCLVLAFPDGHCESAEGYSRGVIVWPPRGEGPRGLGFDALFQPHGSGLTYGEMDMEQRNATNHRAQAFRMLMDKCFQPQRREKAPGLQ